MRISRHTIVVDAPDLTAERSFWAAALDGTVRADDDCALAIRCAWSTT